MASNFQPPPTWANPVLIEKDKTTGESKASFNPVWLDWFIRLTALLGATQTTGGPVAGQSFVLGTPPTVVNNVVLWNSVNGTLVKDSGVTLPKFADSETPTGLVDGINTIYTLVNTPNPLLSLLMIQSDGIATRKVYVQGTDYTVAGNTVTFGAAPVPAGSALRAFYRF